jgi:hypothetical protein
MMFLHEQNETELILIAENLWPLSTFFKSLLFPCLRHGNNFEEGQEEGGLFNKLKARRAELAVRGVEGFEISVEAVSKPWITSEGKAPHGLKAERTRQYVSISSRGATQPPGVRRGFKTASATLGRGRPGSSPCLFWQQ